MGKTDRAIRTLQTIDQTAKEDRWVNRIHPLVKLCLTILYIALCVSFHKYQIAGLLVMAVYPLVVFTIGELSFHDALYRLRIVLPVVCVVGILNPLFDRGTVLQIGGIAVSGGVISMITLMLKAVFSVLASYLLIITTPIEQICGAMRLIRVPKILVVEILLIYRYITVLLAEVHRVTQAYSLRAPGQKGVAFRAWGPLAGQILLRSMDRAGRVYESMCLRGFDGDFPLGKRRKMTRGDVLYLIIWAGLLLVLRFVPVLELLGGLFVR